MDLAALYRCPNHPNYRVEAHGVCCVCLMTTHRHISGFKLVTPAPRVTYRTEAEAYDEGLYDDD